MNRAVIASLVVALSALATGCDPTLYARSVAPPGRTAKLEAQTGFWGVKAYDVEVSQGVALAITCHDGGPCQDMKVISADPQVADIRRASLQNLEQTSPYTSRMHEMNSSGFVVVGRSAGKTVVRLSSKDGSRTIYVTVVAQPPTGAEATRATAAAAAPLRID